MDVKIEYLVDLENLNYKKADKKTILALIGSEKEPIEAIVFEKKLYGSVVSAEDKTGTQLDMDFIETLSLGEKTNEEIYLSVKSFINDRIRKMSSSIEEEVFCTNPDCMNFGCVVEEPIKEKDGTLICPECGEELSTEETSTEDLSFDDLKRIVGKLYMLVEMALEGSDATELNLALEETDISIEEINWIKENCL
ncbi:MAG: hypothetical protein V8S76_00740 [Lachnospiraceae bacterium]